MKIIQLGYGIFGPLKDRWGIRGKTDMAGMRNGNTVKYIHIKQDYAEISNMGDQIAQMVGKIANQKLLKSQS